MWSVRSICCDLLCKLHPLRFCRVPHRHDVQLSTLFCLSSVLLFPDRFHGFFCRSLLSCFVEAEETECSIRCLFYHVHFVAALPLLISPLSISHLSVIRADTFFFCATLFLVLVVTPPSTCNWTNHFFASVVSPLLNCN